jgi:enoyl-CoA hydratase/carnithine racemase
MYGMGWLLALGAIVVLAAAGAGWALVVLGIGAVILLALASVFLPRAAPPPRTPNAATPVDVEARRIREFDERKRHDS